MDATLVEAQVRRPPLAAGRGAKSATDPDADWDAPPWESGALRLQGASGCGCRDGAGAQGMLTPAKVYESEVADCAGER